ncbi:MAG: presenilin family intramembrane aspartyl protease PSH [Methanomassiliicoccaceae archaeon]|jgi:presenilin-like A22 family membrane protease|nr:presenilin family intramembrane aspartyl protease PSH [Methanomassiliicoccaceae archaeon]HOQ25597.1 presenilin family intramembrane aspartyl protease PSH [Methanomassiliicoccaceae archaeon]HQA20393.1 presenilin family intramembrane aspartyl protease PSH [Methanomassiliicoccaceae archaeon]HQD87577.1 presenilin family intramembrane aspartyl protease PSH [Methanomassiliicoccaceae archaeon]
MRPHPVLTMAIFYAVVQVGAILLAPIFLPQMGPFPDPNDPVNPLIYIVMILLMTGLLLVLIKIGRQKVLRTLFYVAVFVTLLYVFTPLLLEVELSIAPDSFGWASLIFAIAISAVLLFALVKSGEWYVINMIGLILAVGITAILGMSLGILPVMILLIIMAVYDAIAVYKTKHMVALAEGVVPMRLPVMFVIPNRRDFSMDDLKDKGLTQREGQEREAFFMGVGDTVIPGILAVSASIYLPDTASFLLTANLWVAVGTIIGGLLGYLLLLRYVMRGKPQAGLPFLNGGAILGYLIAYVIVYQSIGLSAIGL